MAQTLYRIEADSDFVLATLPEPPCQDLSCDAFGRSVVIAAALCLLACISSVVYINLDFYIRERAPGLPRALKVRCQTPASSARLVKGFAYEHDPSACKADTC